MINEIKVFAPASVSNIACGFDAMGFAIDEPGDEIILRYADVPGVTIKTITGDDNKLSYNIFENTAGAPVVALMKDFNISKGVEIEIHKKMPLGSGLGSSAASAVAAAYAANILFNLNLTKLQLLPYAIKGEEIASGAVHADNVAPCLFGGFILIRSYSPIDIIELPVPDNLFCTIIHPNIIINTKESRAKLPKQVPLISAVTHWGNTAGLVAGLFKQDINLIGRAIEDVIIEPVRSEFIPGYYNIKDAAYKLGAVGCNISGSGPSIFALSESLVIAQNIGAGMLAAAEKAGLKSEIYVSKINKVGPKVIYKL